jgi:hypothetical protein
MKHVLALALVSLATAFGLPGAAAVGVSAAAGVSPAAAHDKLPPASAASWYWEISPPDAGLCGLPATSAAYPQPGSANIWDTDLFLDSNTSTTNCKGHYTLGVPTGRSPVVQAIHAAGHYSVCYVEAGAYQTGFPDDANFKAADYGNGAKRYNMQGYPNEWWFDVRGFAHYVAGDPSSLAGAAVDIAAQLGKRLRGCALEGQDAVEPDDLDGYTNAGDTGAKGGGWGLTRADDAGFQRWLAYQAHADGLAVFQKNDPAEASADEPLFDGVITEECNYYKDPCAGSNGDWNVYLKAGKPVLDAEYVEDGEKLAKFCAADHRYGIYGALFSVNLDGSHYQVCWNASNQP